MFRATVDPRPVPSASAMRSVSGSLKLEGGFASWDIASTRPRGRFGRTRVRWPVKESKWPTLKVAEIPEIEKHEGGKKRVKDGQDTHRQRPR